MRSKHNKNTSKKEVKNNKTTQYEEKYNDIILNDLVPEDRKEEFNMPQDEPKKSKRAKKGSLKFNLGKKNTKNKKQQEDINSDTMSKNSPNKKEQLKEEDRPQVTKKTKSKKHHKSKYQNELDDENQNISTKKTGKKRRRHKNKEQDINVKEVKQPEIEDIEEIKEDLAENTTYRGEIKQEAVEENEDEGENNIIWSDENFDK